MRRILAGLVLTWTAVATSAGASPDRWVEARSTHFIVMTNASDRSARHLASEFERMHAVFHALLPTEGDDADPPIVVLALKDRKDMQALEPAAYLGKSQIDLAGFFLRGPEKNYILVRLDAQQEHAFANVYHEYTHYMLRKADGWLPLWLNEGLAQFYENTDIDDKNAWLGQADAEALHCLRVNDLLPIAALLAIDTKSPYYHDEQKGSVFYAESWALTHYLIVLDRTTGSHHVHDYAQAVAQGEDAVKAAQQAFGDLNKLQEALSAYVQRRNFLYFMMPAELTTKDAAFDVQVVSTTAADAVRADVLLYTGRTIEAKMLLDTVLRDDPKNALAHESMGLLRYGAGDIAGAKSWFGEAVGLDEGNYLAHYYEAAATLHGGGRGEDAAIESNLRRSIELNPEFAPGYDTLAMFYAMRNRRLDEAHTLDLRAVELEPSRLNFRIDCAYVLTEQRQFAEAIGVLQTALRLARTPQEVEAVQTPLAGLEKYQTALAGSLDRSHGEDAVGR
jgi:tetratricopeptide (TPR) repeat protein